MISATATNYYYQHQCYYYYYIYFYYYFHHYYYSCFCWCYYYYCCCRWLCLLFLLFLLLLLLIIIIITLKYMKPIKVICKREAKMLIYLRVHAVSVFTMHSFCRFCCVLAHWPCNICLIKYSCTCAINKVYDKLCNSGCFF